MNSCIGCSAVTFTEKWGCPFLPSICLLLILSCDAEARFLYNGVTAHRGNSSAFPENTVRAFESAIALGVDWIELDVRQTSDGCLVVIHDATTALVGDKTLTVTASTLAQLETVDVAHVFRKQKGLSYEECPVQTIPRLAAVLAMVTNQIATRVSLHVKDAVVDATLDLVDSMDAAAWVGFNDTTLARLQQVKQRHPEVPVFWDVGAFANPTTVVQLARQYGVECVMLEAGGMSTGKIAQVRAAGLEVGAWTVNSAVAMTNLLMLGIQRMYTDDPALLIATIEADADEDGLPDLWEIRYFGSTTNAWAHPQSDDDQDGLAVWQEFKAGTDPGERDSNLKLSGMVIDSSRSIAVLSWRSEVGRMYTLSTATNLCLQGAWTPLPAVYRATPPVNTAVVPIGSRPCFFRVELSEP